MKYAILTNSEERYELVKRSGYVVKALRLLQVRSAYYSDKDRYGLIKEQRLEGWIEHEVVSDGMVSFEIKEPDLGADAFRDEVAKLLFPMADTENNMDHIDYEVAEEGLSDFLNFIEPRHRKQLDLRSLLKASQAAEIQSTESETNQE